MYYWQNDKRYLYNTKVCYRDFLFTEGDLYMIPFNRAVRLDESITCIKEAIDNIKICGDGEFTKRCSKWMEEKTGTKKALFTTSCTHALEMCALLIDIKEGDEVIMPSYTFASTADAFAIRGAKLVFVDIRPDTMNMDESLIESAITDKTKAIVVMHYGGVACEMDTIMDIARKHNIYVVEDAAQGMMATYKGRPLGTIGDFGTYSFHETKNYTMGEGGVCLIQNEKFIERAEIIREKGTNRSKFWRGEIDKYTWVDIGSSYLPSEINMAYLWPQLEIAERINQKRLDDWNTYYEALTPLKEKGLIELPYVPEECKHNGHMFYIKVKDIEERQRLIEFLKEQKIYAVFHYLPLHSTIAGNEYGRFYGEEQYTTKESERILRIPMYYDLEKHSLEKIVTWIYKFYEKQGN